VTVAIGSQSARRHLPLLLGYSLATVVLAMTTLPGALGAQAAEVAKNPGRSSRPTSTPTAIRQVPAVPGLSITVTDGRTRVSPGDRLSYTVHVKDGGGAAVPSLKVTLTFPAYLKFISASQQAKAADGKVTWRSSLRPGQAATFRMSAVLTRRPPGLARLAAVACAVGGSVKAVVCAAHLDTLPGAGPAGRATSTGTASGTVTRTTARKRTGPVVAGLVVLILAALTAFAASRIRARRPRRLRHRHSG
jgi:uncharacterized repeat protein (TIGR01451 family)